MTQQTEEFLQGMDLMIGGLAKLFTMQLVELNKFDLIYQEHRKGMVGGVVKMHEAMMAVQKQMAEVRQQILAAEAKAEAPAPAEEKAPEADPAASVVN